MISLPSAFLRLAIAALLFVSSAGVSAKAKSHKVAKALSSAAPAQAPSGAGPEQALSGVLEALDNNRLDLATQRVEALIAAHPNFRLAHLIRGDLLLARAPA